MQKKFIRNDIILIGVIVVLAVASFLCFKLFQRNGNNVLVSINGETVERYSLSKDIKKQIFSEDKNGYENVLVIKDGKAYILSANCADKICVHHRPISKTGESIVCLPHKLVISIEEE